MFGCFHSNCVSWVVRDTTADQEVQRSMIQIRNMVDGHHANFLRNAGGGDDTVAATVPSAVCLALTVAFVVLWLFPTRPSRAAVAVVA
jgi:hypothetical protein